MYRRTNNNILIIILIILIIYNNVPFLLFFLSLFSYIYICIISCPIVFMYVNYASLYL